MTANSSVENITHRPEAPDASGRSRLWGWLGRRKRDYRKVVHSVDKVEIIQKELDALREEVRSLTAAIQQDRNDRPAQMRLILDSFFGNLNAHSNLVASRRSAELIVDRMAMARPFGDASVGFGYDRGASHALLEYSVNEVKARGGLYLEFGVHTGGSIKVIAAHADGPVHGFDSFIGLPEDWKWDGPKGAFDGGGRLPEVPSNVELHAGWFDETLPGFLPKHPQKASFINVDCDLYSSTKFVLDSLFDRLQVGTVIHFDEYFKYQGWEQHEYKAWEEFVAAHGIEYEYIGYTATAYAVSVRITAINGGAARSAG